MLLLAAPIPWQRLLLLALPLALVWWFFGKKEVGFQGRLFWGVLRATVQLSVLGFLLAPLFALGETAWVLPILAFMCLAAAFFSLGLPGRGPGLVFWLPAVLAILPVVVGLVFLSLWLVIPERSVLDASYAISFAGMLAGVAMNSVALSGERFLTSLEERQSEVEILLLHGATGQEATQPLVGSAIRVAVTPGLNRLVGVGLVSIPGTMSGQILAGGDPVLASRYQITLMILVIVTATLVPVLFLHLLQRSELAGHRLKTRPGLASPLFFRPPPPVPGPPERGPGAFATRPPEPGSGETFLPGSKPPDEPPGGAG